MNTEMESDLIKKRINYFLTSTTLCRRHSTIRDYFICLSSVLSMVSGNWNTRFDLRITRKDNDVFLWEITLFIDNVKSTYVISLTTTINGGYTYKGEEFISLSLLIQSIERDLIKDENVLLELFQEYEGGMRDRLERLE